MYSPLKNILLTGGLTIAVIIGTASVYALGAGTDLVALMDKLLVDTTVSTDGTVKNSDKVDGLHASDILNAAGGGTITFSTCSTTDKKQMFYECDPTLPACLTVGAYCGGGMVAGTQGGSLIVASISDEDSSTTWGYSSTTYGNHNPAPSACSSKKVFGFDGWKLPSQNEFITICANYGTIGNFIGGSYWTSSDTNTANAQRILISGCSIQSDTKNNNNSVRCIRKY